MTKREQEWYDARRRRQIKEALELLDIEPVEVDGKLLKASQCYHVDMEPPHVLFNTNCPDNLREKVNAILARYNGYNESSA
jgi:hypothetical protein